MTLAGHRDRLGRTVVHRVVIRRAFDRLPGAQRVEVLHEQRRVERVRVVVVELFALGEGNVVVPLIIIVVVQHAHIAAEFVENAPRDGGLAAAGAAGNADRDDVAHGAASRVSLFFPNILPQAQSRCNLTFAFFAVKIKPAAHMRPD